LQPTAGGAILSRLRDVDEPHVGARAAADLGFDRIVAKAARWVAEFNA
jgi:hypothetical protein